MHARQGMAEPDLGEDAPLVRRHDLAGDGFAGM